MKEIKQAISLVIRDGKNRIFVVKRSPHKNTFPGHFSLPAANLQVGESFGEAAKRVARDKLGLNDAHIKNNPLAVSEVVERPKNLLKMFDYEVTKVDGEFALNEVEYTEYKWMTSNELMEYIKNECDGEMGECTRNFLRTEGLL